MTKQDSGNKFKVGDRVYYSNLEVAARWNKSFGQWGNAPVKFGTVTSVSDCGNVELRYDDCKYSSPTDSHSAWEVFLEFEIIYNSPLYKALA